MRIQVRLYATLRRSAPSAEGDILSVDMPEGGTVADLMATIKVDADQVHLIMVNGRSSLLNQVLAENDRIGLFPAVGGG